jgi:hypothetical protein
MNDNLPQDSEKPLMPRRPAESMRPAKERKPAKLRPLKKQDQKHIDRVEDDCLAPTVIQKACAVICIERDKESAAIELKMSLAEVQEIMDSASVRLYLRKLQAEEIEQMARVKVRSMRQLKIGRPEIERRLMELANMDPEKTKGTIDGQVKALNTLATRFGYGSERDPTEDMTPEELQRLVVNKAKFIEGAKPVN